MNTSESTNTTTRLEELSALRATSFVPYLLPILLIAAFGVLIRSKGQSYALVYFAALTVAFTLHSMSQRQSRREIDLVLALLEEERKGKRDV